MSLQETASLFILSQATEQHAELAFEHAQLAYETAKTISAIQRKNLLAELNSNFLPGIATLQFSEDTIVIEVKARRPKRNPALTFTEDFKQATDHKPDPDSQARGITRFFLDNALLAAFGREYRFKPVHPENSIMDYVIIPLTPENLNKLVDGFKAAQDKYDLLSRVKGGSHGAPIVPVVETVAR